MPAIWYRELAWLQNVSASMRETRLFTYRGTCNEVFQQRQEDVGGKDSLDLAQQKVVAARHYRQSSCQSDDSSPSENDCKQTMNNLSSTEWT